jgi:isoquinoline 1-oxidoreductase beta subunit
MQRDSETASRTIDRRSFLQGSAFAASGLLVGFTIPVRARAAADAGRVAVDAFVHVGRDDRVTLLMYKAEMGQGVYTSLSQLIAEELDCDWAQIDVAAAPVAPAYNHPGMPVQFTGGSTSIAGSWEPLRQAGARARTLLVAAAAQQFGVPASECRASQGRVLHEASGRALRYGEVADLAATLSAPEDVALKPPSEFRLIGRTVPRIDTPPKTDGTAQFSIDVRRPGQVFAVVSHPPGFRARLDSADIDAIRRRPGVVDAFRVSNGVAIVATDSWSALAARDAVAPAWQFPADEAVDTESLRKTFSQLAATPGALAHEHGDALATLEDAENVVDAEYELPYLAHAPMEPLNCVVEFAGDRCDIWAGSQYQTEDRRLAAQAAGLPEDQVHLHTTYLGGAFGRRANPAADYIVEAVEVAKQVRRPVQLLWSREDDVRGGWYRPQCCHRVRASLGPEGLPAAWHHRIVTQSVISGTIFEGFAIKDGIDVSSVEGAADLPYAVPALRVELHTPKLPVPVQWWRSVGHSHTAFVVESFIDELAARAGRDPVEYRRALLAEHPRHLAVLDLAARQSGWGTTLPAGRARGIAVHASFGSVVAEVAEVSLENGRPRVHRVVCAVHCGRTINPGQVAAQLESGVLFGLSAALYSEITIDQGRVVQGNFDDYRVARLSDTPQIEVHIVPSDAAPTGIGEPGTPPIAAAVTNALAALTGVRARRLPLAHTRFDMANPTG